MLTSRTAALGAVATALLLSLGAPAQAQPGGGHHGRTFLVRPSGGDDTDNLQRAFDQATRAGHEAMVSLVAGTYVTRQIVIRDFRGSLRGAGAGATIVTNPEEPMPVARTGWHLAEPSPERPWPMFFTALHSTITVSDLTFRIRGASPLEGWTGATECDTEGSLPCVHDLAAVFFVGPDWSRPERNEGSATFRRVAIEGERNRTLWPNVGGSYFGYNTISGIYAFGRPLSGTVRLVSSSVRSVYDAVQVAALSGSRVSIEENLFEDVGGATFGDLDMSSLDFAENDVRVSFDQPAPLGLWLHDYLDAYRSSVVLVRHNVFEGPVGIRITATFENVSCWLYDNDVAGVTGVGILLGPGTGGCRVRGTAPDRVVDEGSGNVVRGSGR
jgi:hypothetical protein